MWSHHIDSSAINNQELKHYELLSMDQTLPPLHHHFHHWMINFLTQKQNQVGASLEMMVTVSFSQESMAMIWAIPLILNWKVAKVVPDHYLMANSEAVAVFLQETQMWVAEDFDQQNT